MHGHRGVVGGLECGAQVVEGEFEGCVEVGVVEGEEAGEGSVEAGVGVVGVEDAEESRQAGGEFGGQGGRVFGGFVEGAEDFGGGDDVGQGELDEAVGGFGADEGAGEVVFVVGCGGAEAGDEGAGAAARRRATRAPARGVPRTRARAGGCRPWSCGSERAWNRSGFRFVPWSCETTTA